MTNNNIKEKLVEKLNIEYEQFIQQISNKTSKELISMAYEIHIKYEFSELFNYWLIDEEDASILLSCPNTLEFLYNAWLKYEDHAVEDYESSCICAIERKRREENSPNRKLFK